MNRLIFIFFFLSSFIFNIFIIKTIRYSISNEIIRSSLLNTITGKEADIALAIVIIPKCQWCPIKANRYVGRTREKSDIISPLARSNDLIKDATSSSWKTITPRNLNQSFHYNLYLWSLFSLMLRISSPSFFPFSFFLSLSLSFPQDELDKSWSG